MVGTKNCLDAVRTQLNAADPDWQARVRAELDALTPGWESFPIMIWNDETEDWVTVTLLANPEPTSPRAVGFRSVLRRWLKKK